MLTQCGAESVLSEVSSGKQKEKNFNSLLNCFYVKKSGFYYNVIVAKLHNNKIN